MNPSRLIAMTAFAMVAFAPTTMAQAPAAPCAPNAEKLVVCGTGKNPFIVLDETTSPSGKLAVAWRTKTESKEEFPDPADVENHLVRLSDGKDMGLLVGRSWDNGKGHGNHIYRTVVWSPDSRWLVVGDGGKWSLEALAVYAVDEAGGSVLRRGVFVDIRDAATAALEKR
ncbi:MAG: hypothetical protein JSS20_20315, partial [Proteobacteria bacterium]|nr:hypothetical protein [Pseudomonadota bacterium]